MCGVTQYKEVDLGPEITLLLLPASVYVSVGSEQGAWTLSTQLSLLSRGSFLAVELEPDLCTVGILRILSVTLQSGPGSTSITAISTPPSPSPFFKVLKVLLVVI